MTLKSILIGGIIYRFSEVIGLHDDGKSLDGNINYGACEIQVEKTLNCQIKGVVLWHEIIHGVLTHAGFEDHDERMINVLSYSLVQVLKDNPELVFWGNDEHNNEATDGCN